MKLKSALVLSFVLIAVAAFAQMPSKPGPEVKKLDYFVGTWTSEGAIAQGPWGAGGKFSNTDAREWMDGNYFVVGHSDFKMPAEIGGDGKATSYMGYDTEQNTYTFDAFNSLGRRQSSKGSFSTDTWTWLSTVSYGGQDVQQKMTMKILSPTSYTFKLDISIDGTNWMNFMEGKATKK